MSQDLHQQVRRVLEKSIQNLFNSSLERSLEESYQEYLVHGELDIKFKEKK